VTLHFNELKKLSNRKSKTSWKCKATRNKNELVKPRNKKGEWVEGEKQQSGGMSYTDW